MKAVMEVAAVLLIFIGAIALVGAGYLVLFVACPWLWGLGVLGKIVSIPLGCTFMAFAVCLPTIMAIYQEEK